MEFMLQVLVSFCLINFTVESELICSQQPIEGLVGDDVILPCHLEPPISASNETVVWSRPDLDPPYVHYHQDGRLMIDRQNPDYHLRTSLFLDELTDGNVSMKIFRVKLSDAGTYSCSLPSMKKEASIQLIVKEPTDKTLIIAIAAGISALVVFTLIVIILIIINRQPGRRDALNDAASCLDCCTILEWSTSVAELILDI